MNTTILTRASDQWRTRPSDQRFQTLAALRESVNNRRLRSRSTDIDLGNVKAVVVNDDVIEINSAISPVRPSNWAFGQLAGNVGAPAAYLRTLPATLAVNNLNYGISKLPTTALKFMTVSDPDGESGTLQAVTSTTYGRIWDADVVDAAGRIVERSGGKFHNPLAYNPGTGQPVPSGLYASDRDIFVFMIDGGSILEVGPRAQMNRGFFMWNSEVGKRTFGLTTFLFNKVCGNHFIYGARDINELVIRHCSGAPARFDSEAYPALEKYIASSGGPELLAIKRAQAYELKLDPADRISGLREISSKAKVQFTKGELTEAISTAEREEGQLATLWDFTQGLTAYARGFDFIDARTDLEKRASQLLNLVSV